MNKKGTMKLRSSKIKITELEIISIVINAFKECEIISTRLKIV